MFTGIIESLGHVTEVSESGSNKTFWIESPLSSSFKIDQSIAHDGVCLTVEEVRENHHRVTAVAETLRKTALHQWKPGKEVNLEQSLLPAKRLDGHFVQGHVDATGICKKIKDENGSHEFTFHFPKKFASLVIEKGSISLNGISLTIFDVKKNTFKVAIIPYTFGHTNLQFLKEDDEVNLEFDIIGKYIAKITSGK
ncbi:riboflavin synthase [Flavisolibacter ginsenosidimutans]|uniref:Riboflavin synthase n=1 Tax=Flavisolibacter ginsenosidimutans TaxID=661481 RepID=A0A5B8UPZ6_9BACT|nr:riboflavin synthase [Flavisolibacter ginsenosidimutans]QEC58319.1 riboflavin synthase [Flavisolibacter ginsenosidimutans]